MRSDSPDPSLPRGLRLSWGYTYWSLVVIVAAVDAVVALGAALGPSLTPSPARALLAAFMAVVLVGQCLAMRRYRVGFNGLVDVPRRETLGTLGLLFVPALIALVLGGAGLVPAPHAVTPMWVSACLLCPLVSRPWRAPVLVGAGLIATAGAVLMPDVDHVRFVSLWALLAALPLVILPTVWFWSVMLRLEHARHDGARLAVAQERLRFTGELHDVQGHSLQVIALKTDLARRLLDRDVEAARTQLAEANALARDALEATRALVHDYRRVPLGQELRNAETVLLGAGMTCTLRGADLEVDARAAGVLGLAVREATTNVLRHSDARHVAITVERHPTGVTLRFENDGARAGDDVGGSGLAILADRVREDGGTLDVARTADRFTVTIALPTTGRTT